MKFLKVALVGLMMITFSSCNDQLDEKQAQNVVENLLTAIDNENYAELSAFYSENFNTGESIEARSEKFFKLRKALGELISYEVVESENLANFGEPAQVLLTYRVERARVPSIEKFVVIKEAGEYRISSHAIVNE